MINFNSLFFLVIFAFYGCHDFTAAADLQPFGISAGDTLMVARDDAFDEIPVIGSIRLPFLDRLYDRFFVSTNGYVSFGTGMTEFITASFPLPGKTMLSAFWSDIDPRNCNDDNNIFYRQDLNQSGILLTEITSQIRQSLPQYRSFQAKWATVITFHRVRQYGQVCQTARNTFQIILTTDGNRAFGIFNYRELGWIVHGGKFANAGFNAGNKTYYHQVPGSNTAQFGEVVYQSNVGVPGQWMFQVDREEIEDSTCNHTRQVITFVSPRYGSIFGGNEVLIGGVCESSPILEVQNPLLINETIICKFGNVGVTGERQADSIVRCVAPPLAGQGVVILRVSVDGGLTFPYNSTYSYDPVIYDVNLNMRQDWSDHADHSDIQLSWEPIRIDQNLAVESSNASNSTVDVEFFGWYLTGSTPTDGVRFLHLPLASDVPNMGRLSIQLKKINFRRSEAGEDYQVLLSGAFRVVKSSDRINYYTVAGWNKTVPMMWSQLTDMDVFNRLRTDEKDPTAINDIVNVTRSGSDDINGLTASTVMYQINRIIIPNFGQKALQAMTLVKRIETVLRSEDWMVYFSLRPERLQLGKEIVKCSIGMAYMTFCECWSKREHLIIPYDSDDSTNFPPCPPTANQARTDRGRFGPESALTSPATCNKHPIGNTFWDVGQCYEHPDATLCVNALTGINRELQQQCCYGDNGNLLDASVSPGGGRVQFMVQDEERSSLSNMESGDVWLARRLEEQLLDRKPQEMCCPRGGDWRSKKCQLFRRTRRGGSAKRYVPPAPPGGGFGDPHIWTLDGLRYTFNGLGEYVLVKMPGVVDIQGRTTKVAVKVGVSKATVWSGLAFRVKNTTVQLSLSTREGLNLFLNNVRLELSDFSNVVTNEDVLIYLDRNNSESLRKVSAQLMSTGITIDVDEVDSVLQFQVTLPSELRVNHTTSGLLGVWNGKSEDDLLPRGLSDPLAENATDEVKFTAFGETWRVSESESLFVYQTPEETFQTVNDKTFRPNFSPELPSNIAEEATRICAGNAECLFDIASTGNLDMGANTAIFVKEVEASVDIALNHVVSCGYPNITSLHTQLVKGSSYNVNDTLEYDCFNEENISVIAKSGNRTLFCSADGVWIGEPLNCVINCGQPNLTSSLVTIKTGTSFEEGDVLEFTCANGGVYQTGNLTRVCTDRGTWSGEHVICKNSAGLTQITFFTLLLSLALCFLL